MIGNPESYKILKAEILDTLDKIKFLEQKLNKFNPDKINEKTSENQLILIGYYLSGIYSTIEEIFLKVAKEFENKIEDPTKWHAEILNRMSIDIENIRPAIISKKTKNFLDELRKFRHTFRFSYAFELEWEKLLFVVSKWKEGSELFYKDIQVFMRYLDTFSSDV